MCFFLTHKPQPKGTTRTTHPPKLKPFPKGSPFQMNVTDLDQRQQATGVALQVSLDVVQSFRNRFRRL